jgi:DJ-1/PfpI family
MRYLILRIFALIIFLFLLPPVYSQQQVDEPLPYNSEEVTFTNGDIKLAGTLTTPITEGKHPALVMITGSGAQNRDEELFGFKPFKIIADYLTGNGIAVLRYDDRGVGGSTGENVSHYTLTNSPVPDILIIPGGPGRRIQMNNQVLLNWIKDKFGSLELLLSVCTGSFIIGKAGLLDGAKATTHHYSYEEFEKNLPETQLVRSTKFVDTGKIITAAGVSSGINMSLHVINRLFGRELMAKTASHIEFNT